MHATEGQYCGTQDKSSGKIVFSELPYAPIITGIALNSDSNRAVDVRFIAGFDGNSPITKYIIQYRLVTDSKYLSGN